jgi:protoporphyrinogen oxidase
MNASSTIVLGAGIAGLSAAYRLRERGLPSTIFEAHGSAGGLLDNFTVDGFRFDQAVHLSFAVEPEVRAVFDRTPYHTHQPEALCWDGNTWLRHPVQTNMFPLPAEEKAELILGLANAPSGAINNYQDWLIQQYGSPIANRWPLAYTRKYWTVPAERLSTDWVGQRMRQADLREVLFGAMSQDVPNQYYAKEMRYPKHGGYRAFLDPLIEGADIRYRYRATYINQNSRVIEFSNGESVGYDQLVSTMPLPALIDMLRDVPKSIVADAQTLFATEIDLVSVGFRKPQTSPALWLYVYDEDVAAARIYSPDWKSPDNVPEGCSSLQFEIYSSREAPQRLSPDELKENCVVAIEKMQLGRREDIVVIDHRRVPYANVVFDIGMEERRDRVLDWVRSQDIISAGRFGEWAYLWSNQAMMSGLNAGEAAIVKPAGTIRSANR